MTVMDVFPLRNCGSDIADKRISIVFVPSGILKGIAILVAVFDDSLRDDIFKEKVGIYSSRDITRLAKERKAGSMGYAEAMLIAYNRKCKKGLSWSKLYSGRKKKTDEPGVEEYAEEADRLRNYPSTEYTGYYGVVEEKTHELLAVNADPYNGFIYALTDGKSRIIYAEEIFCNYFMDLDYLKYIPEDYLLDGFDARTDNPYRKKMMHE